MSKTNAEEKNRCPKNGSKLSNSDSARRAVNFAPKISSRGRNLAKLRKIMVFNTIFGAFSVKSHSFYCKNCFCKKNYGFPEKPRNVCRARRKPFFSKKIGPKMSNSDSARRAVNFAPKISSRILLQAKLRKQKVEPEKINSENC